MIQTHALVIGSYDSDSRVSLRESRLQTHALVLGSHDSRITR